MCGILGGWTQTRLPREAIEGALDRLRHRGPDHSGVFQDGPAFLGMRRLAIIDLEGGHQPLFNEDGSVSVVFNGEIYNYRELAAQLKKQGHHFQTESDTEVLVHLYEQRGDDMTKELRGMFAFALWDGRKRRLFLARDRFGKKPLYYTRIKDGGFLFASELKALKPLAALLGEQWKIRGQAIYDYLSLCIVPQPDTVYDGVWMLPPAGSLAFNGENVRQGRYWQLDFSPKTNMPYEEVLERTRSLVGEAVRLRLRSDVPLGVFLSGGLDSSVVAYEAAKHAGDALQTFTVSMGREELDETQLARKTARRLGVKNVVLPIQVCPLDELQFLVRNYDQPFADSSAIPSYAISKLAAKHLKVVLNGDGGDELFAGYRRYLAASRLESLKWLPQAAFSALAVTLTSLAGARRSKLGFLARFARGMALGPSGRYLAWTTDMLRESDKRLCWKGGPARATELWLEQWWRPELNGLDQQLHTDRNVILLSALLVKMDMATMAASLEARSPLLDHALAEFAATLPMEYLLHHGRTKAVLRDAYRGKIPDEVVDGAKRGFEIPLVSWLKNNLRELLSDTVGSREARVRDYLEGSFVQDVLAGKTMQDRNWGYITYALLVLELWLREEA